MATSTKPKTELSLQQRVEQATLAWAESETSTLWSLIRIVWDGLEGLRGKEFEMRLSSLKSWVNGALNAKYGEGAAKDREAHVSKIFTIAKNATPDHFKKWKQEGTGFYKAYSEFSKTTPAKSKAAKEAAAAKATGPTPVQHYDPKTGAMVPPPPAGTPGAGGESPGAGGESPKAAGAAASPDSPSTADAKANGGTPSAESIDPTAGWALAIERNRPVWTKLVDKITKKQMPICTPDMVVELVVGLSKNKNSFRNVVGTLLGNETIRPMVVECINAVPDQWMELKIEEAATK